MKNPQSKIKPIKTGREAGTMGVKITLIILKHQS